MACSSSAMPFDQPPIDRLNGLIGLREKSWPTELVEEECRELQVAVVVALRRLDPGESRFAFVGVAGA